MADDNLRDQVIQDGFRYFMEAQIESGEIYSMIDHLLPRMRDWVAHLVFADWLEERGDELGELIRLFEGLRQHDLRHPVDLARLRQVLSLIRSRRYDGVPVSSISERTLTMLSSHQETYGRFITVLFIPELNLGWREFGNHWFLRVNKRMRAVPEDRIPGSVKLAIYVGWLLHMIRNNNQPK